MVKNIVLVLIVGNKTKWVGMRDLSIILLMWGYGLRISEVINLKVSDLQSNNLQIFGKGMKTRLIPIPEEVRIFLKEMKKSILQSIFIKIQKILK